MDCNKIEDLDDLDDDDDYFAEKMRIARESNGNKSESSYEVERDRLLSRKQDMGIEIPKDIWLMNCAISDQEIAETICSAKLIKSEPLLPVCQTVRDLHRSGKKSEEIRGFIKNTSLYEDYITDNITDEDISPEERQAFKRYYQASINESAMREILEYASKRSYFYNPSHIIEILSRHSPNEIALPSPVVRMRTPNDVKQWLAKVHEQESRRIKTSYHQINKYTQGGYKCGSLYGISAGTGVGKSIVLCWQCADFVKHGHSVLYVATEMLDYEIFNRVNGSITQCADIDNKGVSLIKKMGNDDFIGYDVWCASELISTVDDIEEKIVEGNYEVVIIDYGDKLAAGVKTDNEYNRQGIVFTQLARLARKLNIPILVATQQNRKAQKSAECGIDTIGDSIDKIRPMEMLLTIPDYDIRVHPEMKNKKNMYIAKNRNGIKEIDLFFDIDYQTCSLHEPQFVIDCFEEHGNASPEEFHLLVMEAKKKCSAQKKITVDDLDDEND